MPSSNHGVIISFTLISCSSFSSTSAGRELDFAFFGRCSPYLSDAKEFLQFAPSVDPLHLPVGVGHLSPAGCALLLLMMQPNAEETFAEMVSDGSTAGTLNGLRGLYLLGGPSFIEYSAPLSTSTRPVARAHYGYTTLGAEVRSIRGGSLSEIEPLSTRLSSQLREACIYSGSPVPHLTCDSWYSTPIEMTIPARMPCQGPSADNCVIAQRCASKLEADSPHPKPTYFGDGGCRCAPIAATQIEASFQELLKRCLESNPGNTASCQALESCQR